MNFFFYGFIFNQQLDINSLEKHCFEYFNLNCTFLKISNFI